MSMLSFDEVGLLLDDMAEEFPPEFFEALNGGVALLPEAKPDPEFPPARCIFWVNTATT